MAIEYSLLTCLGRDGLTITAATTDVISLTAHGMRAGHPIRFTTTGTLPGGLASDTTYYVSATDLTANSFKVSATEGGSVVDITSTGSGTHKAIGAYWATLPATNPGGGENYRARYGSAGSERVYADLGDFLAYIFTSTNRDINKDVYLEIEGAWTNTVAQYLPSAAIPGYKSLTIASRILGARSTAFHGGVLGAGWVGEANTWNAASRDLVGSNNPNTTLDGLDLRNSSVSSSRFLVLLNSSAINGRILDCFLKGPKGIELYAPGGLVRNCIIYDCSVFGVDTSTSATDCVLQHNIITGCLLGMSGQSSQYSPNLSQYYGNLVFNNTTNWKVLNNESPNLRLIANYNAGDANDLKTVTFGDGGGVNLTCTLSSHGLTANSPLRFLAEAGGSLPTGITSMVQYYVKTVIDTNNFTITATVSGTVISYTDAGSGTLKLSYIYDTSGTQFIVSTADFVDYANRTTSTSKALAPASSSSAQVDVFSNSEIETDISGAVRPSYQPSIFPDELWDAGPYEYDYGNGPAPQQVNIEVSGMAEGSVMAIYRTSDGSTIVSPITIDSSGAYSSAYSYTADTQIEVVVRKGTSGTKYLPYFVPGLITDSGFSLIVNQVIDGVLNV